MTQEELNDLQPGDVIQRYDCVRAKITDLNKDKDIFYFKFTHIFQGSSERYSRDLLKYWKLHKKK